jgi:hypothetical protein
VWWCGWVDEREGVRVRRVEGLGVCVVVRVGGWTDGMDGWMD